MGVVATGIGLDFVLTGHDKLEERWVLAGGLILTFLSMAMILYVTIAPGDPHTNNKAKARLIAVPVVIVIGIFSGSMAMGVISTLIAILVAAEVLTDLVFEPHRTSRSEH